MKKKIIFIAVVFAFAVFAKIYTSPDSRFMRLADDYFDNFYFPDNPTIATSMGIHRFDDKLENLSAEAIATRIATLKKYEEKIGAFDPTNLTETVKGDQELVLNN